MIKVIASDMDGTLLGDDHRIAPETLAAVKRACDAGIRFMVATGRNFPGAMEELKGTDLTCDYVVSSGAEVRNPQQEVVKSTPISIDLCEEVYNTAKKYPVSVAFFTDRYDYRIGTKKEIEDGIIQQIRLFSMDRNTSEEIVRESPQYRRIAGNTKGISDIRSLESSGAPVYKIFIFTEDVEAYFCLVQAKKRGISIPRDLKIVGYDGNEITRLVSPQVTTIAQNTKKLAETCVDVLNKRISGLDTEDRYFVPVKIRMGGTT